MAAGRYRFGVFEADAATGELRRRGMRVKLNAQPMQVLLMMLGRPNEVLTRDEIAKELWPDGTFVDFDHGVNSAVNRIREALGDKASNPRFVETLARRGYRFVAPVERVVADTFAGSAEPSLSQEMRKDEASSDYDALEPALSHSARSDVAGLGHDSREVPEDAGRRLRVLASEEELPEARRDVVRWLLVGLQVMYVAFYVGALANLAEIEELLAPLTGVRVWMAAIVVTAALMIPVRAFVLSGVLFRAPRMRGKVLALWPLMLAMDVAWSMAPFLLLHHMDVGLAFACCSLLVYSPFAQRSLVLMGAADSR